MSNPALGFLLETVLEQLANVRRSIAWQSRPVGTFARDSCNGVCPGVAFESSSIGEHLVHDASERPNIRTRIDRFSSCLFGGHVSYRADNRNALRLEKRARHIVRAPERM